FRTIKVKHPKGYLDESRPHLDHLVEVSAQELPFEYMMNRLRLHERFSLTEYQQRTGLSIETVLPTLQVAKQKQLMQENTDGTWQVSKLGHRYLNDLLEMFL
ncbi:MAG: coproporphyrinogen III oxidase-like Fe-S oxidoreductase, partial [Colwellia sp.]